MDNKLQELTDRLYKEGLSKGKEEGEALIAKAEVKAQEIIDEARKAAEEIIRKAEKEAADYRTKVEGDVKMAATQSIQATRNTIENLMVDGLVGKQTSAALSSEEFIKQIILEVARKFSAEEPSDLKLVLPESLKSQLEPFISGELATALGKGVTAEFSKKIVGGFNIAPKDGSYFISLTDDSFRNLIGEYMRPLTRKILFGE